MKPLVATLLAALALLPQTGLAQLAAPILLAPAHNSVGYQPCATFTWTNVANADKYRIQIAANSTFTTIVDEDVIENARYVPATALFAANRFWRVRTIDSAGVEGAWSSTFIYKLQAPATTFNVTSTMAWSATINSLIASATTPLKITFSPGTYNFTPATGTDTYALRINSKENVVIDGANALIKLNAATAGGKHIIPGFISIQNSEHISIRRFAIEHNPIPHFIGIVKAIQQEGSYARLTLKKESGYPDLNSDILQNHWSFGVILDRLWNGRPVNTKKGRLKPDASFVYNFEKTSVTTVGTGTFSVLVTYPGYGSVSSQVELEDPVIIFARESTTANPSAGIASTTRSTDVAYEEITAYTSPSGHFSGFESSELKVLRCNAIGRSGRWFGGNADGVHCFASKIGPWIEGCEFNGIGDDAIALYGKGLMVRQKLSGTSVRIAPDNMHFSGSDQFKIFRALNGSFDSQVYTVASVATGTDAAGKVASYDITFSPAYSGTFYTSGTTDATEHHNDQLFSITERNAQFVIRNNNFGAVRRYGCAVRSTQGLIVGNTFQGVSTAPLALFNEASSWRNGPYNYNILVAGNVFNDNGFDLASRKFANIHVEYHKADPADQWGNLVSTSQEHGLITIVDNTFENWEYKALLLSNAYSSSVGRNVVNARRYPSLLPGVTNQAITLAYTSSATVFSNTMTASGVSTADALVIPGSTNTGTTVTNNVLP